MNAESILNQAVKEMENRGQVYDAAGGERSMRRAVAVFNALEDQELTEEQGWKFMCCLKLVRSSQGKFQADDYVDGSAYFGLAGESASQSSRIFSEKAILSTKIKNGIERARSEGKDHGRPKGSTSGSKLDCKEQEIDLLLRSGVNKAAIAKIMGVSRTCVKHFVSSRDMEKNIRNPVSRRRRQIGHIRTSL